MTDTQIIKALECCLDVSPSTCKICPLFNITNSTMVCSKIATKFALDLINRQNKENKAFGQIIKMQDDEISQLRKKLLKMGKFEEDFSKERKKFDKKMLKQVKIERAEAIKEFAERLTGKFCPMCDYEKWQIKDAVDSLVKEMAGDLE